MSLIKSNKCRFCNSKNIQKIKIDNTTKNFYVKAIISDLNLSINKFKSIKTYECKNCNLIFNNPWFKEEISRKIYSNVYGQHHNNWQNLINFVYKKILPDHGGLFSLLNNNIKIKNYAEYNSPFMGLFLNFFYKDIKNKKNIYKDLNENIIQYLSSRQLAGSSKKKKKQSIIKSRSYLLKINKLKKKYSNMHKIKNKILFYDQSYLNWGINDNYKSINSKAYAQEIFDLNLFDINFFKKKKNLI